MKKNNFNSGDYKQHRANIIADFSKKFKYGPTTVDQAGQAMDQLTEAVDKVKKLILPVMQAGGAVKPEDREKGLRPMVNGSLLQSLDGMDKESLMFCLAAIIGDKIMQDVEADPWGRGTPDLLSGK